MFAPKPRIAHPDFRPDAQDERPHMEPIIQQGNPNLMPGDGTFPADLGLSRQDVYPSRHAGNWFVKHIWVRWIV